MYKGIEENEISHKIDENINYYSCEQQGYDGCWMFKSGELSNRSIAMKDFNDIEREIGTGILREIRHRAIDEITLDYIRYCVVPVDEVIDVYDTYEHNKKELQGRFS